MVVLEPQLPKASYADGIPDFPPQINSTIPIPSPFRSDPPQSKYLVLEDHHSLREGLDLVDKVTQRITTIKDRGIIRDEIGEDILLD